MKVNLVVRGALSLLLAAGSGLAGAQTPAGGAPTTEAAPCAFDARQPNVRLSGAITDPSGGSVQAGTVTLRCGNFRRASQTSADGGYEISAPAGAYVLEVQAPGFEPMLETISLGGPEAPRRDISLKMGRLQSIVSVTATGGYVATSSTSATKTDTPLIEIPHSVSVITLDQMKARNVQTVNDAIQFTGSVATNTYGSETRYDWIYIRGFNQSAYGLFRDNSRWQSGALAGQIDPYMLQEVDVIKGPSSVLFGQNTPGGLVNLVTKRPPPQTSNEVAVSLGSYHRRQLQGDLGGPLGDGRWRYRLTGLFRDSDTQVKFVGDDRWLVAPALTWAPSQDTTFTILGDYQHDKTGWSQFLPSQGVSVPNPNGPIPIDFFAGEPDYDFFKRDQWSVGTLFEHRFGEHWTVRNTFRRSKIESQGETVFGGGLKDDLRTLNRFGFGYPFDLSLYTTDSNAFVRANTGRVKHSLLFGVDYSHSTTAIRNGFSVATPLDVYAPVYGAQVPDLFYFLDTVQPSWLVGVYVQDHAKISNRFVATLSARHDWTQLATRDNLASTETEQSPDKFSGRVGATYLSDVGLAPYVSYSTSFLPVAGVTFDGTAFAPTNGVQVEGGIKFQPKHSNSFLTASLFNITQSNVLVPDPDHQFNSVQQGEVRARGLELEGVGSVAAGLNFNVAYSYVDQEVTATTDSTALGKRPPLVPKQLFKLSAEYTFSRSALAGLGFIAGVRYVGEAAGDSTNSITIPGYTLIDASARYLWKDLEFLATVNNLADKTYVPVCTSVSYCNYGVQRQVIGTVRYHWGSW